MPARRDHGFTMIEVIVTIALATTLMSLAVAGWSRWSAGHAYDGALTEVQAVLRNAQQRAVTEGRSVCVLFDPDANSYRVLAGACGDTGEELQGPAELDTRVRLRAPAFETPGGSLVSGVTFTSRGTASPGSVQVVRRDGSGDHEVRVEGLTGRVAIR